MNTEFSFNKTLARGDISDAFNVTLKDSDNVQINAADFICKVAVATDDNEQTVVFSRVVTEINNNGYLVWIKEDESIQLEAGVFYNVIVQVEKADQLPKAIKKEVVRERFKATKGLID